MLKKINCRNRRSNRYIKAFGKKLCLAAWEEETGLNRKEQEARALALLADLMKKRGAK